MGEWSVAQEGGVTVALDTTLDDALRAQGLAREFSNRVQTLRKSAALNLTDRIRIRYASADELLAGAVAENVDFIASETLAKSIDQDDAVGQMNAGSDSETDSFRREI